VAFMAFITAKVL